MDWSHFLGPCPSSMPSTRNCNTPLAHRLTGMPESLSKMFYFHPSGLQFALAQSVFWGFPSSFHAHLASPPLSAVFPIECILHTFTFRSASVLSASVYTPPYSSALFLTYVSSYGPWNPVEGLHCSLLAEGRRLTAQSGAGTNRAVPSRGQGARGVQTPPGCSTGTAHPQQCSTLISCALECDLKRVLYPETKVLYSDLTYFS